MNDTVTQPNSGTAGTTAAAATTTQAPAQNWIDTLPENLKGVAALKGWKSPDMAVQSYNELERFVGADKAGRGLIIPGDKATPEEIAAFRAKSATVFGGIPTTPDGYELKLPDGFPDPEFGKKAAEWLHKHNIPKADAQGLMAEVTADIAAGESARAAEEQKQFIQQETSLKNEWGPDFDKNVEISRRGFRKAGVSEAAMDAFEELIQKKGGQGFVEVLKMGKTLGDAFGENNFVDGDSGPGGFTESHDALLAKRKALYADKAWADRYWANDASARNEAKQLEEKIAAARKRA